jgi:hypothetical protein
VVDNIGPIRFSSESKFKDIVGLKYYKETMGAFFHLLKIKTEKRKFNAERKENNG